MKKTDNCKLMYDFKLLKKMSIFLVYSSDVSIKYEVARHGCRLDILTNDVDWVVRAEVARQGYGLDKLVYDPFWEVRYEVARNSYGLDILINDLNPEVKEITKSVREDISDEKNR